jgi:hypothetical protein
MASAQRSTASTSTGAINTTASSSRAASYKLTGSGIPTYQAIQSYSPYAREIIAAPRSNYPTNSFSDSRESNVSLSSYNEYAHPELQLAATAFAEKGKDLGLKNILERTKRDEKLIPDVSLPKDEEGRITLPRHSPVSQNFHYQTSNAQLGKLQPKLINTAEHRYFPRTHNFTKTFTANYRSWGLAQ